MLQLMTDNSGHFTHTSMMRGCGIVHMPVVIREDHGQMLMESARHSLVGSPQKHVFKTHLQFNEL